VTVRLKWKHLFVALAVAAALVLTGYVAVQVGRSINRAQEGAQVARAVAPLTRDNCQTARGLADVLAKFLASDGRDRAGALTVQEREQVINGFSRLLGSKFTRELIRKQHRLDAATIRYWRGPLLREVRGLARPNCGSH